MALYLVQHGKSFSKEQNPEQSLTEEGIAQIKLIGQVARGYNVNVDIIRHSGKKRARQTAEIFSEALQKKTNIEEIQGIKPMDNAKQLACQLKNNENAMYVSHLPFLGKLLSYLITGSLDYSVFRIQNGGIICLDQRQGSKAWEIKWALMPSIG